jgi:hypothetical protein
MAKPKKVEVKEKVEPKVEEKVEEVKPVETPEPKVRGAGDPII